MHKRLPKARSKPMTENKGTLADYRHKKASIKSIGPFLREHCPYLFNLNSLFYFGAFLVAVGFLWMAAGLISNSFSSAYNWDYSHQYLPFAYDYRQIWLTFFSTGEFPLYDPVVFIGNDNIGSNSYYGLFDPFIVVLAFFPESWIPQLFALATVAKLTITGLGARAYLRYLGRKEWTSRLGAVAWAFSGYFCFFVGFPSFVSALAYVPLILLGIEKTIREGKIGYLVFGIFLLEMSCFMLLVPMCIWGVIYALWRFFSTCKGRNGAENVKGMLLGVAAFACGLALGSFCLFPSIRQSSLTGRASSIGAAYMNVLLDSLKSLDGATFLTYFFEEVGANPARELMGLVSFFFPTGGFQSLPLLIPDSSSVYDAWMSSIFCYTPFIILFFSAILISIKERKTSHLVAVLGGVILLFTTFAYYAFFAFSGNGYGRWFFVLIPEIIAYGCYAFDKRKEVSPYIYLSGGLLSLFGTFFAYFSIYWCLEGVSISSAHGLTYFFSRWLMPTSTSFRGLARNWYLYYQVVLVALEGVLIFACSKKRFLPIALTFIVAAEACIAGNSAYCYISTWSIKSTFMGGKTNFSENREMADNIRDYDDNFYRAYFDSSGGIDNYQYAVATPESSSFHSLMNFEAESFAVMNGMKSQASSHPTYGGEEYLNPGWSASYRGKLWGIDTALGYRYYITSNDNGRSNKSKWVGANIPFGATKVDSLSMNNNFYHVYRVGEEALPTLGHAVDKDQLYRFDFDSNGNSELFARGSSSAARFRERIRSSHLQASGAIFEDDAILPDGFEISSLPSVDSDAALLKNLGITRYADGASNDLDFTVYVPNEGDKLLADDDAEYAELGASYIFDHHQEVYDFSSSGSNTLTSGSDFLLITPHNKEYFNEDPNGCYIELKYYNGLYSSGANGYDYMPRVIVYGDVTDEDGNVTKNQVLGFEGKALKNVADCDQNNWTNSMIGIYAYGRATSIALVWPDRTVDGETFEQKFSPTYLSLAFEERSSIEEKQRFNAEMGLQNVKKQTNSYTFETGYDEDQIVVTQLGYDQGWSVEASLPDGTSIDCPVYKLDGGLVGFLAPAGKASYVMSYFTPSLDKGLIFGTVGFFFITGYYLYWHIEKRRRHYGISVFDDIA